VTDATGSQTTPGVDPLDAPLSELVLVTGALRLTQPGHAMEEALAGADLMTLALFGQDVGDEHAAVKWIHQHAKGRLQLERERIRSGGRIPLEPVPPGEDRLGVPTAYATGVANVVIGALRQPDYVRDKRLALLIAMLARSRFMGFTCVLLGIRGSADGFGEQIGIVNRSEAIASGDEPSGLRLTQPVRTVLGAVGRACMDRDFMGPGH